MASRRDVEDIYGRKNPAGDYGGRMPRGATQAARTVVNSAVVAEQLALFGEKPQMPQELRDATDTKLGIDPNLPEAGKAAARKALRDKSRALAAEREQVAARHQPRRF